MTPRQPKLHEVACLDAENKTLFAIGWTDTSMRESTGFTSDLVGDASPLFPPEYDKAEDAQQAVLHTVRRDPRELGIDQTRWTLEAILSACDWLRVNSPASLHPLLERLGISWKRGRDHVHSPDPMYQEKLSYIGDILYQVKESHPELVLLYLDELTYYRQPSLGYSYEQSGHPQPLAERSLLSDTYTRIVGTLDAVSGQVLYSQNQKVGIVELRQLYIDIANAYPDSEKIYVVQDNWPNHFHPDVLVALAKQELNMPRTAFMKWGEEPSQRAKQEYGHLNLPIQIVPLPTYASWTNPIEKLWRYLKQTVLHLHRYADKFSELNDKVRQFLDRFAEGSQELLRYVGLLTPD